MPSVVGTAGWATGVAGGGVPVWEVPRDSGDGLTWYTSFKFAVWAYNIYGVIVIIERSTGVSHVLNPFIGQFTSDSDNQLFTLDASEALGAGDSIHCIYWPKQPVTSNPNLEARLFAGGTDIVNYGNNAAFNLLGDMGMAVWTQLNSSVAANEIIFGYGYNSLNSSHPYHMMTAGGGDLMFAHETTPNNFITVTFNTNLADDKWYFVAMARDIGAGTVDVYVWEEDGTLVFEDQLSISGTPVNNESGSTILALGSVGNADTGTWPLQRPYHGACQEHYLWNRKPSKAEFDQARVGNPPASGLVLSVRVLGANPEVDESPTGASGTVSGTTLVPGHL